LNPQYEQGSHFLLTKNAGLFQDFPGLPSEIFQDLFGAHECLNIKKKPFIHRVFYASALKLPFPAYFYSTVKFDPKSEGLTSNLKCVFLHPLPFP